MNSVFKVLIISILVSVSGTYFYSVKSIKLKDYGSFKNKWLAGECREIGYISKNSNFKIVYTVGENCEVPGGTTEKFVNLIKDTSNVWIKPLGLNFYIEDEFLEDYTIRICVLSREEFRKRNLTDPANEDVKQERNSIIGIVNRDSFENVGIAKVLKGKEYVDINVYEIHKATIYIIWDDEENSNFKTSGFTYQEWAILLTHEFGHVLGYRGHNDDSNEKSIMNKNGTELIKRKITKPTQGEIDHLENIYNYKVAN